MSDRHHFAQLLLRYTCDWDPQKKTDSLKYTDSSILLLIVMKFQCLSSENFQTLGTKMPSML